MAAIMSRRRDQITEITKLMDECKAMGIDTLGPDVNESYQKFGVNKKGEIRFGLAAIKGMGDGVAQAIIDEREKNGPYKDMFDFVERINFAQVNRKAFEALALSGGFDSFGIRREDFFAQNTKGDSFIDVVMRYGQNYQAEKQEALNSLFGAFDDIEIQRPAIPKSEERWSDIERLNKERELVGIYLSAHPLDEYKIVLDNLCNTRCGELADVTKLTDREDVILGGIVTGVRTGFTKNGKPYGIVTLEDFEGSGELALFGEDWGDKSGFFTIGASVYVTGKIKPRFSYNADGPKDLKITGVEFLQTVKDKAIDRITISMSADMLDDRIVAELGELIAENPGNTSLFIQLHDSTGKKHVLLRSTTKRIDVKRSLIHFIEQTPALDYKIN
jgi:DNA polymerase-3 subunit alpha